VIQQRIAAHFELYRSWARTQDSAFGSAMGLADAAHSDRQRSPYVSGVLAGWA